MAEEKMTIEIGADGKISVDLHGFKGKGCAAIVDLIEEALGPSARKNKPEYEMKSGVRGKAVSRVKTGT
jgi:hypothetical protein